MEWNEENLPLAKWLIDKTELSHRKAFWKEASKGRWECFERSRWQR